MHGLWVRMTACAVGAAASLLAIRASAQVADGGRTKGSLGAIALFGGNFFTTPDHRRLEEATGNESEGLGFSGDAGGFGWGAGVYAEARPEEYLGLSFGFLYDQSILKRDVDFRRIVEGASTTSFVFEERVMMRSLRFPFLVKGILPVSAGRLWAGLGPEIVATQSVDAELDSSEAVSGEIRARESSSVMLAFGLGAAFELGDALELPVELRAARNLSQSPNWDERVDAEGDDPTYTRYTVIAQSTWDFRLGVGVGYRF